MAEIVSHSLQKALQRTSDWIKLFNRKKKLLNVQVNRNTDGITFSTSTKNQGFAALITFNHSKELQKLLGLSTPDATQAIRLHRLPHFPFGKNPPPLKFRTPALYVYSDIIEDVCVGDSKTPLLRTVGIDGGSGADMGQTRSQEFLHPHYKPVKKGYINNIFIEIKDDTGRDIDFTTGKVICTLHFRRCGLVL